MLKKILYLAMTCTALFASDCKEIYGEGQEEIRLATGSPGELGLLKELVANFNKINKVKVCWIKAGSGKTLELLKNKKIDIAMVHAPKAEKEAVAQGWASNRTLIGSNEFYIIGPKDDPAHIKSAKTADEAYKRISQAQILFYTRADNSGTHKKEMSIWQKAGIKPQGSWYVANKDFMLATLKKADENKGYFMTDSSTYKVAQKELKNSEILFKGDLVLVNTYVAMSTPNPKPIVKAFIDFLASKEGQNIIKTYGMAQYGQPLYEDAKYAQQYFQK